MLSGCNSGSTPKTPTGQVVATVGSREITRRELQAELAGAPPVAPKDQKAQQMAALQRIIQRVILAEAAKQQGLDKEPDYALLSQRANDALLVQLLENKTATSVPAPTNEEVQQFQETNPNMFAERKIFDVDQIRVTRPSDPQLSKKLEPAKTLEEVATYLNQNHVPFQRGPNSMDAAGQNPKLVADILALPPHEVFILSSADELFANVVTNVRTDPLVGEAAAKFALNSLKARHVQEAVLRQLNNTIAKARGTVRLSKDFEPAKTPAKKLPPN